MNTGNPLAQRTGALWVEPKGHSSDWVAFPTIQLRTDNRMPDEEFHDVARQLEETLSELNQVNEPTLRRSLLSDMRRLIAEADRLAAENTPAAREEKPEAEES